MTTAWPKLISPLTYVISNVAVPGETLATMLANYSTNVAPLFKAGKKNVVFIWGGTNDFQGGASEPTVYANLTSYISAAHATGFTVVAVTMLDRGIPNLQTQKNAYNADILANAAGADAIVSFVNTPLGVNGGAANTEFFNVDEVHPNNTGETQYIVPAMNAAVSALP